MVVKLKKICLYIYILIHVICDDNDLKIYNFYKCILASSYLELKIDVKKIQSSREGQ